MRRIEVEMEREARRIFEEKKRDLGVEARLELGFLGHAPIVGKNVYGEAFPFERPPLSEEEIAKLVPACAGRDGEHPQDITMDEIRKLVDEVPDVDDPARTNYWVPKNDILIYLEGWSDACLAGTGFPLITEGDHENKINYIRDLTPGILKRKAEERGLRLIHGGFMEREGATNLYGVTYGVYRKPPSRFRSGRSKFDSLPFGPG